MKVQAGSINVSVYFYIQQDASGPSPGEPVTGLLFSDIETGGSASYMRQGAARTDLTLITLASASAAHADGGFILVDDTNMPGLYRCDYPDAAFTAGFDLTICSVVVAAAKNAVAAPILIDIDSSNNISAAQVNAEMVDVLTVDAQAEPTGVPAANAPMAEKIDWLFTLARNKVTQTNTTKTIRNDADSSDIATAAVSDDSTTFTREEFI